MKTSNYFLLTFISFFSCFVLNAQTDIDFQIQKAGFEKSSIKIKNDTIFFLISKSKSTKPKPTILFIQGSKPLPLIFYDQQVTNSIIPFDIKLYTEKFNFIVVARKGIPLVGTYDRDVSGYKNEKNEVPKNYTVNDNLYYRVNQVKQVLNYLYKSNKTKKDSIFIIGHSEGYRVAAKLSEKNKKIAKLVCMSADPFNRIAENIMRERMKSFETKNDSTSQIEINELMNDYRNISISKIQFKDKVEFKNWLSYNENLSYESLQKFKNPLLIVYGTDDIGSIHNDLIPFLLPKNCVSIKAYSGYGHNFEKKEFDLNQKPLENSYHWDEVFEDILEWLISK
jgi:esterase/lipase